jgi:hypothetical protein
LTKGRRRNRVSGGSRAHLANVGFSVLGLVAASFALLPICLKELQERGPIRRYWAILSAGFPTLPSTRIRQSTSS